MSKFLQSDKIVLLLVTTLKGKSLSIKLITMDNQPLKSDLKSLLILLGVILVSLLALFFWNNQSHFLEELGRRIFS